MSREELAARQLGSNQDIIGMRSDRVDRSSPIINDDLAEVDFLFDDLPGGNLELFRPDQLPGTDDEEALGDAQVAIKPRINDGRKSGRSLAKDQIAGNDRLPVAGYSPTKHRRRRSL